MRAETRQSIRKMFPLFNEANEKIKEAGEIMSGMTDPPQGLKVLIAAFLAASEGILAHVREYLPELDSAVTDPTEGKE